MRRVLPIVGLALTALVFAKAVRPVIAEALDPQQAAVTGVVYEDRNGNDQRDPGERGVRGVSVTDGTASTDSSSTWHGGSPTWCSSPSRRAMPCRPTST